MKSAKQARVLFVCLGNICRSPTAEIIFQHLVDKENLGHRIQADSAGTGDWHIGKAPDSRARRAALQRGYDMGHLRGRQVQRQDFQDFDFVLAMDRDNLANLRRLKPTNFDGHLGLFLAFGEKLSHDEVPDPYFGGDEGFELVLDLIESAAEGLLQHITAQLH